MCKYIVLIQDNKKILIKFAAASAKMLKQWNAEMLTKDFIQHRYYGSMFTSFLLYASSSQLESVTKIFVFKVVPTNLKISEQIDA